MGHKKLVPIDVELDAIIDQAYKYRNDVYRITGVFPERFVVTEKEYRVLLDYYGDGETLEGWKIFGLPIQQDIQ